MTYKGFHTSVIESRNVAMIRSDVIFSFPVLKEDFEGSFHKAVDDFLETRNETQFTSLASALGPAHIKEREIRERRRKRNEALLRGLRNSPFRF